MSRGQKCVPGVAGRHHEMDGQGSLRGADRPDMQVMDPRHARYSLKAARTSGMAIEPGTPCNDSVSDWRRRSQVVQTITAAMKRLITGSIHLRRSTE